MHVLDGALLSHLGASLGRRPTPSWTVHTLAWGRDHSCSIPGPPVTHTRVTPAPCGSGSQLLLWPGRVCAPTGSQPQCPRWPRRGSPLTPTPPHKGPPASTPPRSGPALRSRHSYTAQQATATFVWLPSARLPSVPCFLVGERRWPAWCKGSPARTPRRPQEVQPEPGSAQRPDAPTGPPTCPAWPSGGLQCPGPCVS